jgi:hypothetical protein
MMKTTGAAITEIIEAYGNRNGEWVRISEIAEITGLTRDELTEAITELMDSDDFLAEPEVHRHRITDRDREVAPVIGGEARHLICWGY